MIQYLLAGRRIASADFYGSIVTSAIGTDVNCYDSSNLTTDCIASYTNNPSFTESDIWKNTSTYKNWLGGMLGTTQNTSMPNTGICPPGGNYTGTAAANVYTVTTIETCSDPTTGYWFATANRPTLQTSYTNATTTFSNVTDGTRNIAFTTYSGQLLNVDCRGIYQGATGAGLILQWTGPTNTFFQASLLEWYGVNTSYTGAVTALSTQMPVTGQAVATTATNYPFEIHASILPTAAGTLQLQAKSLAAATLTIPAGFACTVQ